MISNKNTFFNHKDNMKVFLTECCKQPIFIKFKNSDVNFFLLKIDDVQFYCGECKLETKLINFMEMK